MTDDDMEIHRPPVFQPGTRVRARRYIKNDGTLAGAEPGEVIVRKGDEGYVRSIGTFLNRFYVYGVDFVDQGRIVGMRARELEELAP